MLKNRNEIAFRMLICLGFTNYKVETGFGPNNVVISQISDFIEAQQTKKLDKYPPNSSQKNKKEGEYACLDNNSKWSKVKTFAETDGLPKERLAPSKALVTALERVGDS